MSDSLWPHGLQHTRPPCASPIPGAYSNSCPSSQWCHPTISSSVTPFSSCLQSFPASGSFPVSQFFASGGRSIGISALASALPMNIKEWFPLRWTGWISHIYNKFITSLIFLNLFFACVLLKYILHVTSYNLRCIDVDLIIYCNMVVFEAIVSTSIMSQNYSFLWWV